ncbi:MAG: hypothetical protein H0T13_03010 [Actinobacteria bacterium]|nr:hypothetical protein [Actinomycetota bacterium]
MALGRPGEHLGRWRWPLGAAGGAVLAVMFALVGDWKLAAIVGAAAVLCAFLTVRSFSRGEVTG